jgi:hypothetical protein
MRLDVLEEFAEAAGLGREWLPADRYSVTCTSRGPRASTAATRAYKAAWMRAWRKANPELARAADRKKYAVEMASVVGRESRRLSARRSNARRMEPDRIEHTRALARMYWRRKAAQL